MDTPVNGKGLFAMLRSDQSRKLSIPWCFKYIAPLKTSPPRSVTKKFISTRNKFFYDIQVYVVEMSQVYQKTVLFDQKRFFRYFRAPKPPPANPKNPS